MPAESTPAEQRQAVIDRLNNTDLSRLQQRQAREDDEPVGNEPEPDETTEELPEEPEEDPAPDDDAPEDEPEQDEAQEQMDTLRGEIEELKAKLEKATAPGGTGSPPSGGPAPSASKAFTKIREKLAKSRTEWGELVDATGLEELLNELEPMVEQLGELKKSAEQTKLAETRRQVEQAQRATANVHSMLDGMARRSPELARLIGTAGTKATKSEIAVRQAVLEEAQAEQARAYRLSGGRTPMSDEDALLKGAQIVFRAKSGKALQISTAEQKARERARMITPSSRGGSTAVPANSVEAGRQRAEANVEAYLRNRGG